MAAAPERKLTTILSADVSGYSRLMGRDEAGTLATLRAYRESIGQAIANHRGRVVNLAGDAVLAEFSSVVNAVECAVAMQRELAERNAALPEERRMWFRIGINLGDVMVENGDLFGEGVNVAARLQALADPGGILISGTVFDHVKNKLTLGFDYLGPQAVKNIEERIPTYRVLLGSGEAGPERSPDTVEPPITAQRQKPSQHGFRRRAALAGILIATVFTVNMLTWHGELWFQWPTLGILLLFALRSISVWGR